MSQGIPLLLKANLKQLKLPTMLAEFEKLSSNETQPESSGFFAKVKDFFGTGAGSN